MSKDIEYEIFPISATWRNVPPVFVFVYLSLSSAAHQIFDMQS